MGEKPGPGRGKKGQKPSLGRGKVFLADAEKLSGIRNQQVSRWRQRLTDRDSYSLENCSPKNVEQVKFT